MKTLAKATVEDFDRFWETFRSRGAQQRRAFGSTGSTVLRNAEDEHEVWIVFDWAPDEAKAFVQDPESQDIMRSAGLRRPPELVPVEEIGALDA